MLPGPPPAERQALSAVRPTGPLVVRAGPRIANKCAAGPKPTGMFEGHEPLTRR